MKLYIPIVPHAIDTDHAYKQTQQTIHVSASTYKTNSFSQVSSGFYYSSAYVALSCQPSASLSTQLLHNPVIQTVQAESPPTSLIVHAYSSTAVFC